MFDIFFGVKGADKVVKNLKTASEVLVVEDEKRMWEATGYLSKYAKRKTRRLTGRLARSIQRRVEQVRLDVYGYVGSKLWYAKVQEEGRIIRPKRKKFLAIPLAGAELGGLMGGGMGRSNLWRDKLPKEQKTAGQKYLYHTFVRKTAGGSLVMFGEPKSSGIMHEAGPIVPLFLLRTQVNIPARPFLRPSGEACKEKILETVGNGVRVMVAAANTGAAGYQIQGL